MQTALLVVVGLFACLVGLTFVLSLTAARPPHLGITDGQLAAVPDSPNCVSTQTDSSQHQMQPIAIPAQATSDDVRTWLQTCLAAEPGVTLISADGDYVHAEFRSRLFRFVDDVEFLIDIENHQLHFRSASRTGRSDLGVNRARMERLTDAFHRVAE